MFNIHTFIGQLNLIILEYSFVGFERGWTDKPVNDNNVKKK